MLKKISYSEPVISGKLQNKVVANTSNLLVYNQSD